MYGMGRPCNQHHTLARGGGRGKGPQPGPGPTPHFRGNGRKGEKISFVVSKEFFWSSCGTHVKIVLF
jgi:hypothetical protein